MNEIRLAIVGLGTYWDVYLREICNQLGVTARVLSLVDFENGKTCAGCAR